jgi:hypothetical protein
LEQKPGEIEADDPGVMTFQDDTGGRLLWEEWAHKEVEEAPSQNEPCILLPCVTAKLDQYP